MIRGQIARAATIADCLLRSPETPQPGRHCEVGVHFSVHLCPDVHGPDGWGRPSTPPSGGSTLGPSEETNTWPHSKRHGRAGQPHRRAPCSRTNFWNRLKAVYLHVPCLAHKRICPRCTQALTCTHAAHQRSQGDCSTTVPRPGLVTKRHNPAHP